MQGIRRWLDAHPDARHELLDANPSYVFFRLSDEAIGSLGVPVTGGRTLATDFRVFPKGALCFAATTHPKAEGGTRPVRRFMLDQDTGGAIRTAGHVDFFFGAGREAEETAGRMKQAGTLYYLLLR
jgi:membrane-bound lytic murein transglycosylase A